jgi:hypothetical protein
MFSNSNELAWLAGLFDGEGCVGFYRKRDKRNTSRTAYYIVATIAMTHAPTIQRVVELTGSQINFTKRYKNEKHRTCFAWRVQNAKARVFLEAILPYSFTKAEEIRTALAADALRRRAINHSRLRGTVAVTEETEAKLDGYVGRLKLLKRVDHGGQPAPQEQ